MSTVSGAIKLVFLMGIGIGGFALIMRDYITHIAVAAIDSYTNMGRPHVS